MDNISRELDRIANKARKLGNDFVGNVTFDYEEQELIRRVFKSVFHQIKNKRDKETARTILSKTEWIDG